MAEQSGDEVTIHWTETVNRSMTVPASQVFDWLRTQGYEIDDTRESIGETYDDTSGIEDFVKNHREHRVVAEADQLRFEEIAWIGWNGDHLRES